MAVQQLLWVLFIGIFTIPLYVVAIGLIWWLLRGRVSMIAALALATAFVGLIAVSVPMAANLKTERDFTAARAADVALRRGFHLAGDLRVETIDSYGGYTRWRAKFGDPATYAKADTCGNFCRSLLAMPGVTSVTIFPPATQPARDPPRDAATYRRATTGCVPLERSQDYVDLSIDTHSVSCVVGEPPLARTTLRLISTKYERERGTISNAYILRRLEILDGEDRALFRYTAAQAYPFRVPLMIEFTLDARDGPFTISRTIRNTSPAIGELNPVDLILPSRQTSKFSLSASEQATD